MLEVERGVGDDAGRDDSQRVEDQVGPGCGDQRVVDALLVNLTARAARAHSRHCTERPQISAKMRGRAQLCRGARRPVRHPSVDPAALG